jgi:hypothetical protein
VVPWPHEHAGDARRRNKVRSLHALLCGAYLGLSAFFLFSVGAAFGTLPGGEILPFFQRLFPDFYGSTAVAALLAFVFGLFRSRPGAAVLLPLLALLLQLFGWLVLFPAVHAAIGTAAFGRLHGEALLVALAAAVAIFLAFLADLPAENGRR